MTLDDLERRNSLYFVFFLPISISLLAKYVTVVEYKPIMSINIVFNTLQHFQGPSVLETFHFFKGATVFVEGAPEPWHNGQSKPCSLCSCKIW